MASSFHRRNQCKSETNRTLQFTKHGFDSCPRKAPTKEKHREFAKQNLGNTGRKIVNPFSEYYPVTVHLGFRSAEKLCLGIAKIAAGKICLFKLVHTSSDCTVLKNTNIFPREAFFGLNPPRHQKFFFSFIFLETMKVGVCRVVMNIS